MADALTEGDLLALSTEAQDRAAAAARLAVALESAGRAAWVALTAEGALSPALRQRIEAAIVGLGQAAGDAKVEEGEQRLLARDWAVMAGRVVPLPVAAERPDRPARATVAGRGRVLPFGGALLAKGNTK